MTSLFAANKKKKKFFGWWQMLVFVLLLIGLFLLLFPKGLFIDTVLHNTKPSRVSVSFLKNLIAKDPTNVALRMNLAKQNLVLGELQEAKQALAPLISFSPTSETQWRALWLYYQIYRVETFQLRPNTLTRREKENYLKSLQTLLANSPYLTSDEQVQLADEALSTNTPEVADVLYKKVMLRDKKRPIAFYVKAAKAAMFVKDYEGSAEFYRMAMEKSTKTEDKRLYFTKALNSLSASGDPTKTLAFAEKNIDGLKEDQATLFYITKVALRAGQQRVAEQFVGQLLHLQYQDLPE
ncbi:MULTISPECIES: tetratricopeptide repeat protein [Legionella]|uniref:Tetratricopeptide repeat protein n=1 Tax=Legionella drozanskii LLAP-1 TaxID=1212489 RepID=A0A0W0SQV5_9GAMM|nr:MULTISPECIES: hypothetical protein [Legionella]KTC85782.1 hypothetical protein Ldro_2107 [Legionella drozanskii LLAP-1]PJE16624.1 MAG: hypothetical protein CK430_03055 [Legionella sp.]